MKPQLRHRWVVLGLYAALAGLSQLLWLNFAPILSLVEKTYAVSETTASLLLLVFPLTYVLLSLHAGALTDRRGYKYAIGLGAILMSVFSCLRIYTASFWVLLVAQTGISLGQPYIVNGMTKLVMDWFPAESVTLATGLGTVGLFIGMAVGLAATPPMVESMGLQGTMVFFAVITCVFSLAFLIFCREKGTGKAPAAAIRFGSLLKSRPLLMLFFVSFVGLAFFNGLTSWIEALLAPNGINSAQAGIVGGVLIIGGIFGSAAIPALSERIGRRKPFLILSTLAACATLIPLCRSADYRLLLIFGFLQGFFFLPAYALLLDMTALEAGEERAGSATGILMLTGNAGGVIAIFAMGVLKGERADFPSGFYFLLGLLILTAIGAALAREPAKPLQRTLPL